MPYAGYQGYGGQKWKQLVEIAIIREYRREARAVLPFDEMYHWWKHPCNWQDAENPMVEKAVNAWNSMLRRCHDPKDNAYHDYGGRGIRVHESWAHLFQFQRDMGLPPSPDHSLDRIDNDRGYEPGNVRWATKHRQQRNKRCTIMVDWQGRRMPLADVCDELDVSDDMLRVIRKRVAYYGWTLEEALRVPLMPCGAARQKGRVGIVPSCY
jgi:hypothetical protein